MGIMMPMNALNMPNTRPPERRTGNPGYRTDGHGAFKIPGGLDSRLVMMRDVTRVPGVAMGKRGVGLLGRDEG